MTRRIRGQLVYPEDPIRFHRRSRFRQCRRMSDRYRFLCTVGTLSRRGTSRMTCPGGFSLFHDNGYNCPRRGCHNRGMCGWAYCTSQQFSAILISFHVTVNARLEAEFETRFGRIAVRRRDYQFRLWLCVTFCVPSRGCLTLSFRLPSAPRPRA